MNQNDQRYDQQPQSQPQSQSQNQQQNQQNRRYDDETTTICSFSFTSSSLVTVSLVRRMPFQPDPKERYFAFLTFAPGVGQGGNRTYDFRQRITQKVALRDMAMIAFALKQAALGNFNVLPYKGYTNSGSGSKCMYLQRNENGDGLVLGMSQNKSSINIVLNYPQAHSIGQTIDTLYAKGMALEIDFQMNERNRTTSGQSRTQNTVYQENEYNSWESEPYE
ncbi:MAG: hypothetical protein IKO41_17625 [Lachnospiraceae bacterium]|nr:hypothetical protein [Lachnospiraceae bacterium]